MTDRQRNILYWVSTALIALNWAYGGTASLLRLAPSMAVFQRLGYPDYFATLLGAAQLLGVAAILAPVPRVLREWAYAGLTFDATAAIFSLLASRAPAWHATVPAVAVALVLTSYRGWRGRTPERMSGVRLTPARS